VDNHFESRLSFAEVLIEAVGDSFAHLPFYLDESKFRQMFGCRRALISLRPRVSLSALKKLTASKTHFLREAQKHSEARQC
jgi:hypothetical protein